MNTMIQLDFDEWVRDFKPLTFDVNGIDIQRYLIDLDSQEVSTQSALHRAEPDCVWSFVEGDGVTGIVNGVVDDATAYLVTEVPANDEAEYLIYYTVEPDYEPWD